MSIISISAAALSDEDPYTLPTGLSYREGSFKVVSNQFRQNYGPAGISVLSVTTPVTSGYLESKISMRLSSATNTGDLSAMSFVNSSGNGYAVSVFYNIVKINVVTAFSIGSQVGGTVGSLTYSVDDYFRARYTIATDTIDVYQVSASDVTPIKTETGLTFSSGMAEGALGAWFDTGAAGFIRGSFGSASALSIDTIDADIEHGQSGSFTYTGLGTITAMTVDGIPVTTVSGTSGSGTYTMPARVDGAMIAGHGTKDVVITGTLGSASTTIDVVEAAAQQYVTITSLGTGVGALATYYGIATTDEITSDTPATLGVTTSNIGADTLIHTDYTGTQTIWWWDASTKVVTKIYVINGIIVSACGSSLILFML